MREHPPSKMFWLRRAIQNTRALSQCGPFALDMRPEVDGICWTDRSNTWNANMSRLWKREFSKSILLIFPCLVYGMVLPLTPVLQVYLYQRSSRLRWVSDSPTESPEKNCATVLPCLPNLETQVEIYSIPKSLLNIGSWAPWLREVLQPGWLPLICQKTDNFIRFS